MEVTRNLLIRLRSHSVRWNLYLTLLMWSGGNLLLFFAMRHAAVLIDQCLTQSTSRKLLTVHGNKHRDTDGKICRKSETLEHPVLMRSLYQTTLPQGLPDEVERLLEL